MCVCRQICSPGKKFTFSCEIPLFSGGTIARQHLHQVGSWLVVSLAVPAAPSRRALTGHAGAGTGALGWVPLVEGAWLPLDLLLDLEAVRQR